MKTGGEDLQLWEADGQLPMYQGSRVCFDQMTGLFFFSSKYVKFQVSCYTSCTVVLHKNRRGTGFIVHSRTLPLVSATILCVEGLANSKKRA
jgi:hypothetical protein